MLVAVGDPGLREALAAALEADGQHVVAMAEASLCIARLLWLDEHDREVGVLVLGEHLVDGEALAALGQIRALSIDVPALVVVSLDDASMRRRAAASGARVLAMPFDVETLCAVTRALTRDERIERRR